MNGNISGLRELFSQGLAQPGDMSATRGFSLWALYGGLNQYATVQYLLQEGAPVDDESYDHVNDFIHRKRCKSEEEVALKPIWSKGTRDWFDVQNFPQIHRILLAGGPDFRISLVNELKSNPNAVFEKDAKGRTVLDWATARAQLDVMRLLIGSSNVDSMDRSGRTTVLHAVDSHNHAALEMVLKAGANPNPKIPEGWHRSSPLTSASFGGLTEMVDLLLEHGATINTRNPEGRAALHTAIIRNKHEILRIFVEKCDGDCLRELELLPVIAQHADEQTKAILKSSGQFPEIFDFDYDGSWEIV
ncbi:ankyrin repeat-containing domain protein [Colletotrichum godetiae]|uniref:Ankyrin repeat-containing domain protein n=1 Tax=Colletotrichum godetiae TaxID=1209918 RepID=A0AAJ0A595_9PEZI|nr:ankyrin repeat-containing domain protein [Colletotrichum godetiae]KAK1656769.1 ankyrin repeat-containing domain protein [Colletotrichum godetiae]